MATTAPTLADRLREIIPPDRVIDDPATLVPYAYDASFWSLRQQRLPDVVVVPRTTAEVAGVVLADGSVITTGGVRSKALKSSSGIDLTKLFVGSEGTLGIITRLRLRVQPRPPARGVVLAGYAALEDTVASLDDLFAAGVLPSTAELLDRSAVEALQRWKPELGLPDGEAGPFFQGGGTPRPAPAARA